MQSPRLRNLFAAAMMACVSIPAVAAPFAGFTAEVAPPEHSRAEEQATLAFPAETAICPETL